MVLHIYENISLMCQSFHNVSSHRLTDFIIEKPRNTSPDPGMETGTSCSAVEAVVQLVIINEINENVV